MLVDKIYFLKKKTLNNKLVKYIIFHLHNKLHVQSFKMIYYRIFTDVEKSTEQYKLKCYA